MIRKPALGLVSVMVGVALLACGEPGGESTPSPAPTSPGVGTPEPSPTTAAPVETESPGSPPPVETESPTSPSPVETEEPGDPEPPPYPEVVGDWEWYGQSGWLADYTDPSMEGDWFISVRYSSSGSYDSGAGTQLDERLDDLWYCYSLEGVDLRTCAMKLEAGGYISFQGETEEGVMDFAEQFLELWDWR